MTIVKIAVKALAAPIILVLGAVYVLGNALISMSSPLTNLFGGLFILGAFVEWMAGAPDAVAWSTAGCGAFLLMAPLIAKGMLEIVVRLSGPFPRLWAW